MSRPPRVASWLVQRLVAPHLADAVVGDLNELFADDRRRSPLRAWVAFWTRAIGAVWRLRLPRSRRPEHQGDAVMATFSRDLLHGLRLLVAQPSYSVAAVVTLALAIGANTLIFTMVNLLVLKPLPLRDPDRLGWILTSGPNASLDRAGISLPEYATYREGAQALTQLAAWRSVSSTLRIGNLSQRVDNRVVVGDLHGLWGLRAVTGRVLSSADEGPAAARVALLSHRFWTTDLGRPDDVVGQTLVLDGEVRTVVGVMAPEIELGNLAEIDVWTPVAIDPMLASRSERGWRPVGRLQDGASIGDAQAQVAAISTRLATEFPETNRDWTSRVGTTTEAIARGDVWVVVGMLGAVVGLLLALACANIMNLLIARLVGRLRELAVRAALGATSGRVVRQIVSESLVIGVAGGLAGVGVAALGLRGVHALSSEPIFQQLRLDPRSLVFAGVLAFVAPLIFSLVPAWRLLRTDVFESLGAGSARAIGGGAAGRGRSLLVVVQVSLAVMLLVVATLMVKSVRAALATDLGYSMDGLVSAEVDVPVWMSASDADASRLRGALVERVRAVAGVEEVALTTAIPALTFPTTTLFDIDGRQATSRDRPSAGVVVVTPEYFGVTGVPIVAGRGFDEADAASPHAVAVVTAEAARRYWGGPQQALGATVRVPSGSGRETVARVIGVSGNTANADLDQAIEPVLVLLDAHRPMRRHYLLMRARSLPVLAPALRAAFAAVHPELAPHQLRTVAEVFREEMSSGRMIGWLFSAFAVVAMVLATAGLYGVLAFVVSQRTPEIAVRLALGASAAAVARDVVGHSTRLACVGTAVGLIGAVALAHAMRVVLYGVAPTDPTTYASAVGLTLVSAVLAAWVPMRRARAVDPIASLRQA